MTLPYLLRLMCISLASFFLLHAALGTLVALLAPAAIRLAERLEARRAARFVLAVRLFPATSACFVVAALCVPSYLRLEPKAAPEGVGLACLAAAVLGLALWGISLARGGRAISSSLRFARASRRSASRTHLPGEVRPVWVMEGAAPLPVALAGVVRPQLVISRGMLNVLSPDQLEVALRHEHAHRISRDNLKRLLLVLAPGLIPFVNPWQRLERNWARFTEWAADDMAVVGDPCRSLSLAAALVRVARACPCPYPSPLVASLVGSGADLEARVNRLLDPPQSIAKRGPRLSLLAAAFLLATLILSLEPGVISFVHEALEHLIS